MKKNIILLECTLRDGGLGFEDIAKSNDSGPFFEQSAIKALTEKLTLSKVEIIELGAIEESQEDKTKFAIYQNVEEISQLMPTCGSNGPMYAALYRGPDIPLEKIPVWRKELCKGARVILRYSELKKSLDFCAGLASKGYSVFVQPMLTMRYTDQELQMLLDAANDMDAFATYFVDSYGYMQSEDIRRLFERYNQALNPNIKIGFHAHNNQSLAFANSLEFLQQESDRDVILDSCIMGLGQGAGNLQTEIIANHCIAKYNKDYNYGAILDACEIVDQYWTPNTWGYSVTNFISSRHKAAYKYAMAMRNQYHMSYREIDQVFSTMSYDLKQRFTSQDLKNILARTAESGKRA